MALRTRIKQIINAFRSYQDTPYQTQYLGPSTTQRPYTSRTRFINERTIISSIYNRIAIDVSSVSIRHVKLDDLNRYSEDMKSRLNSCFTLQPNIDQGPTAFRQDVVGTLFDNGCLAIVPVDVNIDPETGKLIDILTLRVGRICDWYPKHVRVSVYNEMVGYRQDILIEKSKVAIVENPLYAVINEPNSTMQRLIRKLNLLDVVDETISSGKLDLIIQLPYVIKSEARRQQAEQRRSDIEFQLKGSQYGIAYTDGTEKITQLNRPAENNLLVQVEYLTKLLYSQLGITDTVMNGTADEATMINYYNRTVEPILTAMVEAMNRSFVGYEGTLKNEKIMYFRDPFRLVPVSNLAEIADKFTRNEIFSSNEMRGFMGIPPSDDPKADQLMNSNMPQPNPPGALPPGSAGPTVDEMDSIMSEVLDGLTADIDALSSNGQSSG